MELKERLKRDGWTQRKLGAAIGVSQGRVSQMLKEGAITPDHLPEAHRATGYPLHVLNPHFPREARAV